MQPLSKQIALLLAAGGPKLQYARVTWPLQKSLVQLHDEAEESGVPLPEGLRLELVRDPDSGRAIKGVNKALLELIREGVLRKEGSLRQAKLRADNAHLEALRRDLMRQDPATVRLIHRAGIRWEAFSATASKNRSALARSAGSKVASSTPKRAKSPLADIA